jgi:hypothetical protein
MGIVRGLVGVLLTIAPWLIHWHGLPSRVYRQWTLNGKPTGSSGKKWTAGAFVSMASIFTIIGSFDSTYVPVFGIVVVVVVSFQTVVVNVYYPKRHPAWMMGPTIVALVIGTAAIVLSRNR